jgi:hypothetical protein
LHFVKEDPSGLIIRYGLPQLGAKQFVTHDYGQTYLLVLEQSKSSIVDYVAQWQSFTVLIDAYTTCSHDQPFSNSLLRCRSRSSDSKTQQLTIQTGNENNEKQGYQVKTSKITPINAPTFLMALLPHQASEETQHVFARSLYLAVCQFQGNQEIL